MDMKQPVGPKAIDISQVHDILLSEFLNEEIVSTLSQVFQDLSFSIEIIKPLLTLIKQLNHIEREHNPIKSSFIIYNLDFPSDLTQKILFNTESDPFNMYQLSKTTGFINNLDGFAGTTIIKSDGAIEYIISYPVPSKDDRDPLNVLPENYFKLSYISKLLQGLLFYLNGKGRIFVFYKGALILSYQLVKWFSFKNTDISDLIECISSKYNIEEEIILKIIKIAFVMSEEAKGGLIYIGEY